MLFARIFLAFLGAIARHRAMHDTDRFKLLFGPYQMPRCRVGRWLTCAIRGRVKVVGITSGLIQWPRTHSRALIICGGLLRAIRRESNQAVARWWGVSELTVSVWRRYAAGWPTATATGCASSCISRTGHYCG
jgi:hypothetical protein